MLSLKSVSSKSSISFLHILNLRVFQIMLKKYQLHKIWQAFQKKRSLWSETCWKHVACSTPLQCVCKKLYFIKVLRKRRLKKYVHIYLEHRSLLLWRQYVLTHLFGHLYQWPFLLFLSCGCSIWQMLFGIHVFHSTHNHQTETSARSPNAISLCTFPSFASFSFYLRCFVFSVIGWIFSNQMDWNIPGNQESPFDHYALMCIP